MNSNQLTYNQWHEYLSKELTKDYRKLKLIKNEKVVQTVSSRKSKNLRSV